MKAEETKITGKILKVKEQKYRSYKKVAVLERRNISPRMGGKNGVGLPVEGRLAEALWKLKALGFCFLCLEWWVGDLQNEILVQKCSWGKPKGAVWGQVV